MSEPHGSDERLAEAFRALADSHSTELSEDLRERIWLAVSGVLPPEERRQLVEETASDPACAEAWRIASELWRASQAAAIGGTTAAGPGLSPRWGRYWLTAAVLLLGTAIGVVSLLNRSPGDDFRASPGVLVESLVPADRALPRDAFRLRWTAGPEGSRYQVRVTTEDLQVLATAADLTTPEFVVDPAVLATLPGGATVFWQVEVSVPNGERLASPTFMTRVG